MTTLWLTVLVLFVALVLTPPRGVRLEPEVESRGRESGQLEVGTGGWSEKCLDLGRARARVGFAELDESSHVIVLEHQQAEQIVRPRLAAAPAHEEPQAARKIRFELVGQAPEVP